MGVLSGCLYDDEDFFIPSCNLGCLTKFYFIVGTLASKIARKDSLALKLSLRPDRDELIARNIIRVVSEQEQQETKEAIGAKLIRYAGILIVLHQFLSLTCGKCWEMWYAVIME